MPEAGAGGWVRPLIIMPYHHLSSCPKQEQEVGYDLSRYRPPLQYIMQQSLEGKLSAVEFPQAGESASPPAPAAAPKARSKASWASHGKAKETSSAGELAPRAGPRLIIFVIGGMCHSEVRAAYELSKKYQRDVVIGSTELFEPAAYVQLLKSLSE
jgi:hypothetical protein